VKVRSARRRRKRSNRILKKRIAILSVIALSIAILAATWLAGNFLSAPANETVGNLPTDLTGSSVQFPSESGTVVRGWLIPGRKGAGAIVLMHGVRANRLSMLERARFLAHAGYAVLLFDFQAHGESPGNHITFGYLERDARAVVNFLRATAPGEKIGVVGVSMGGASALLAAPPLQVDAMVLEMVYPSINQAVSDRLTVRFGKWSRAFAPLLTWQLKPRLGVSAADLQPIDKVGSIQVPKLFIAGSVDQYTTLTESRQMFDAACEPKALWVVNGAGHEDLYRLVPGEYEQRVLNFFSQYLQHDSEQTHH
jgi:alpha-beta hydrolase superfamily lysophospholipase